MAADPIALGSGSSVSAASPSLTTGATAPAGSTIVVAIYTGGSGGISSVSDGANTYTNIALVADGGGDVVELWCTANIAAPLASGSTISATGGTSFGFIAAFYLPTALASPLDVHVSGSGSGTSPTSGNTAATAQANEVVIGLVAGLDASNTTAQAFTAPSGYTDLVDPTQ